MIDVERTKDMPISAYVDNSMSPTHGERTLMFKDEASKTEQMFHQ